VSSGKSCGEDSVSTFQGLAVNILWGGLSFTRIQIVLCNTIFYFYVQILHVSIKKYHPEYTAIYLNVTLAKIMILFSQTERSLK
jgi:hypothetical protein